MHGHILNLQLSQIDTDGKYCLARYNVLTEYLIIMSENYDWLAKNDNHLQDVIFYLNSMSDITVTY